MRVTGFAIVWVLAMSQPAMAAVRGGEGGMVAGMPLSSVSGHAAKAVVKKSKKVDVYARRDIGDGQRCEVGASLHGDLLREQPAVTLHEPGGAVLWQAQLPIPKGFYQGRATHCVASPRIVYVLVQLDSSSHQFMNETVLQVVELNRRTGVPQATREIDVPHVTVDYTAWVSKGTDNFRLEGHRLAIRGEYALMSDRNPPSGKSPTAFTVEFPVGTR